MTSVADAVAAARDLLPDSGRRLLGVAGAPGAGKSALAAALCAALAPAAVVVPMDGFHLSPAELAARGLADVKGAPATFDRSSFVALLRRLRSADAPVPAPAFDRATETTVPDAIVVATDVRLVVVEGNYLLHWPEARAALDEVWYVVASSEERRVDALIARHVSFGRTVEAAGEWVARSDEANARLIAADQALADRFVTVW